MKGFTLIELMIVVLIIAILASIAYPSYISYMTRTHRVAAEGCLSEYANYMERYYATNLRYDQNSAGTANSLPALDCAAATQTGANYSYDLPTASSALGPSNYLLTATPAGVQASRDTKCGTLSLDQTGTRAASGPGGAAQCW
jgi:type IV pilus assembly protein PilE